MAQAIRIKMMDKSIELDLPENSITKSSITSALLLNDESVISLSYEKNGRRKFCRVESGAGKPIFLLPDGWTSMQFFVESDRMPYRPPTPADQVLNERPINPYYPAFPPDPAPTSEAFIKWMYFLQDERGKAATICVHPRFFVTFRHGTHLQFKLGDALTMYSAEKEVEEQVGIDVRVVKINEELDFVLLKSKYNVVERGPTIAPAQESKPFTLAGFGNEQGSLSYLPGVIHSVRDLYLNGDFQLLGPFILGTSRSSRGDSGGSIWGSCGLIGMNVGCTKMPLEFHHLAISEAAIYSAKNIICPATRFKDAYMKELEKERKEEKGPSPPPKKLCLTTEFEGLGTFYGSSD